MAVFLLNICKFNKCGMEFGTLVDLIQHIEENHIGKFVIGNGAVRRLIYYWINMDTKSKWSANAVSKIHRLWSHHEARLSSSQLCSALHNRRHSQGKPTVFGELRLSGIAGVCQCQRKSRSQEKNRHQAP